jgi:subtilase family serine protease
MGRRTTAVGLAAGLVLAGAPLAAARAALPVTLTGVVPAWAVGPGSVVRPDEAVAVQLVLPWRDRAGAAALVRSVSEPGSPHYRDFVSAETFRGRFSPAPADVAAVAGWLRASGLEVGQVPANRLYVPAHGPAAVVAKAFGVQLRRYAFHGDVLRAPDRAPSLPASVARRIVGVRGLADEPVAVPDPLPVAMPDQPATPADSTPPTAVVWARPCSAYHGATVQRSVPPALGRHQPAVTCETSIANQRAAYGANRKGIDGTGQTVVVVGSHAIQTLPGDVAEWSKRRGLPALRPGQLQQISYPSAYQTPTAEPVLRPQVWALQSHMLIENLHAMAPGADLVYLGTTSSLDLANGTTLAVDAGLGDIVMNGWYSAGENTNQASIAQINQTAQQAAATGISLLFASGSIGDNSSQGSKPSPEYPANDPLVTAVGATSLIVGRGGSLREVGWAKTTANLKDGEWDDDKPNTFRGSGGGTSAVHAQPDYQKAVVPERLAKRSDGTRGRAVPDVAVNGDAETGIVIGLTQRFPDGKDRYAERRHASDESATAVFAALLALANQAAGKNLGFVNPAMYALHAKGAFRDVVRNGSLGAGVRTEYVDGATPAKGTKAVLKTFEAYENNVPARGYDTSTGLGSPSTRWLTLLAGH